MTRYRPVRTRHPAAGWTYGIIGEVYDEHGILVQHAMIPDISCDYLFVSRLAAKCTAGQLNLEQLLDVVYDSLP